MRKLDILTFADKAAWDLIFCRELYPFTRVNEFTSQLAMVSALLDGLRPGGVIVLSGSAVQWPHCTDYALLIETLRRDPRVAMVRAQYPEALIRRCRFGRWGGLGALAYRAIAAIGVNLAMPVTHWSMLVSLALALNRLVSTTSGPS